MRFSIIVPTCNRNELLIKCLNLLSPSVQENHEFSYEVIVTDDSKDNKAKILIEEDYSWVKWVEGPKKGPAANRNNGARYAKGEWLVFIDDDCLPAPNLLRQYFQTQSLFSDIIVFEGCTKPDREKRSLVEESPLNTKGGYLWSCNFMIQNDFFTLELNGFDEQFLFPAMEDVDLNYRIKKSGKTIVFVKNAFVIHPWRLQMKQFTVTLKRFKSILYFLEKHPEKERDINSIYFLKIFFNSFFKHTLRNACRYNFRGFFPRILHDILHLYFAFYMLIKKIETKLKFIKMLF